MRYMALSLVALSAVTLPASADDKPDVKETNKPEVQARLTEGWDKVVFGKELDHGEYVKLLGSVAASVAAGNPTPLVGYTKQFIQESIDGLSTDLEREIVLTALRNPDKVFASGKWEISAGFATYEHRKAIGIELPDKIEIHGLEITVRKQMKWAVTDLPNTFQPYVRIRLKK